MPYSWEYYDFKKNWQSFNCMWNSEQIQSCVQSAFHFYSIPYQRGSPLWRVNPSLTNDMMTRRSLDEIYNLNMVTTYKKRMKDLFSRTISNEDHILMITEKMLKEVRPKYEPKNDSIESYMFQNGGTILSSAFSAVAGILFDDPVHTFDDEGNDVILVPSEKQVFNLYDFFWETPLYDDDYYAKLCRETFSYSFSSDEFDDYDY